jgi:hypothetical protein
MNTTTAIQKHVPHAEANRIKYMYCRELITDVLGWTIDMMELLKLECGCELIETRLQDYPGIIEDVKYTKGFFWPWFMNQWALRDEEFVLCYGLESFTERMDQIALATRHELMKMYCEWHQEAMTMAPMVNGFEDVLNRLIKRLRYA